MIGTETSMREGLGLGLGERITRKEGGREVVRWGGISVPSQSQH